MVFPTSSAVMLPLGWIPGPSEWIIIGAIALLLFGKRLPEVGRSLGKGIVEFKKGLKGIEEEVETAGAAEHTAPRGQIAQQPAPPAAAAAPQHKFDPYTGKPIEEAPPR